MNSHVPVLFVAAPFALKLFNIIPPDSLLRRLLGLNANHSNLLWTETTSEQSPTVCQRLGVGWGEGGGAGHSEEHTV